MSYIGNSPGVASQRIVTIRTATAGQTEFFPDSGYVLGYIDVIIGGVDMTPGVDYTANDGVKVVLTEAAEAGEIVKLIAYIPRGLSDGYLKSEADALLALKADLVGGKIPSAQLPAYVDDVLEFDNLASFPATGEFGKIYVDKTTNATYRWSGSTYIVLTDLSAYYTSAQVNSALALKADKSTTYTKTETDNLLSSKANTTDVNTALALKANQSTTYTKTETDNFLSQKLDIITYQQFITNNGIVVPILATDPVTSTYGLMYYNSDKSLLKVYTPQGWGSVVFSPLGSQNNPAISAAAIKAENPSITSGLYWLRIPNVNNGNAFQTYCDFNIDGGIGYAMFYNEWFTGSETGPYTTEQTSTAMYGTAAYDSEFRFAPTTFLANYNNGLGATRMIYFARSNDGSSAIGIGSSSSKHWVRISNPSNGSFAPWAGSSTYESPTNSASFLTNDGYTGTAWHSSGHDSSGGVNQISSGQHVNDYLLVEWKIWDGTDPNHFWMVDSGQAGDVYFGANSEYTGVLNNRWGGMLAY